MKRVDLMNCWWKLENDEWIVVYTEDLKQVKKLDLKVMATYEKSGKIFGYQFKVERNSKEYKKLFKSLGLKSKDEYKIKKIKVEVEGGENIGEKKSKKESN